MIVFAHANGFPALTYSQLFEYLTPLEISFPEMLGHGDFSIDKGWSSLTDELIYFIETHHQKPVVGMGHSLGGVLMLWAGAKRPDLFSELVIMDPPLFSPIKRFLMGMVLTLGGARFIPPVKKTLNRRTVFPDRAFARDYFASKSLFRQVDDRCLDDYVRFGLKNIANGEGVELSFSAKNEALIFQNAPFILTYPQPSIPTTFLYAKDGEVLGTQDIKWQKRFFDSADFMAVTGGHMFPLEYPEELASLIKRLLSEKNGHP